MDTTEHTYLTQKERGIQFSSNPDGPPMSQEVSSKPPQGKPMQPDPQIHQFNGMSQKKKPIRP